MKKYRITFADGREQHFINANFDSRKEAGRALMKYINDNNMYFDVDDDDYLTPFDFNLEEVESDVNEIIYDFETARERLGLKPNTGFIIAQAKFDPKTLQPFDKVLALINGIWRCDWFSHLAENGYKASILIGLGRNDKIIPYNEDTKHLVGTSNEAPEYYRYWED